MSNSYASVSAPASRPGGSGGNGLPSAISCEAPGGSGGNGFPSANGSEFGGNGGKGFPSATSVSAFGGIGGNGFPSATNTADPGGKGGNGLPSACSCPAGPWIVRWLANGLTQWVTGSSIARAAMLVAATSRTLLDFMDDTSSCHPVRARRAQPLAAANVLRSERESGKSR